MTQQRKALAGEIDVSRQRSMATRKKPGLKACVPAMAAFVELPGLFNPDLDVRGVVDPPAGGR